MLTELKQENQKRSSKKTHWCPGRSFPLTPWCFTLFALLLHPAPCHAAHNGTSCASFMEDTMAAPFNYEAAVQPETLHQPLQDMACWGGMGENGFSVSQTCISILGLCVMWLWHQTFHWSSFPKEEVNLAAPNLNPVILARWSANWLV